MPGQVYMVTCVTHDRMPIFADFLIGRILVREISGSDAFGWSRTLSFVVMPDHLHWLFELGRRSSLSGVVDNLKSHSARKINVHMCTSGRAVWQRGFHDHAMRNDESVIASARYIIANPLRAGLVRRVGDYPLWDAVWL
jgi:putative transposase